jgi:hypothetical protein
MPTENKSSQINKTLSTARDLEPNLVNAARGEMLFAMDSRRKRSLIPLRMLLTTEHLKEQ